MNNVYEYTLITLITVILKQVYHFVELNFNHVMLQMDSIETLKIKEELHPPECWTRQVEQLFGTVEK